MKRTFTLIQKMSQLIFSMNPYYRIQTPFHEPIPLLIHH